jgi:N-acetylglucosaminyldiphosphoundecaprenol N-acetyl-beta-D-mannosaminyltransferase
LSLSEVVSESYSPESAIEQDHTFGSHYILGMRVDASNYDKAASQIVEWGARRESRYVCIAAVNNVVEAHRRPEYRALMNQSDFTTSDGMPLVWGLRKLGIPEATRVYGPDLTPVICEQAARAGVGVGFYGGTPEVLEDLVSGLTKRFPALRVTYRWAPPFRPLTDEEEAEVISAVNASGTGVLLVGLGAPKQEQLMARLRGEIAATMVGVGAAFDFLAGKKRQSPPWMQRAGLEWLFRLVTEPKRLWRRYLLGNPRFAVLFAAQLIAQKLTRGN